MSAILGLGQPIHYIPLIKLEYIPAFYIQSVSFPSQFWNSWILIWKKEHFGFDRISTCIIQSLTHIRDKSMNSTMRAQKKGISDHWS